MVKRIGPKKPFRHYISEWMERKKLSQVEVAGRMECEPGTVSKLLSGKMRLSDVWLAGFAHALDVEIPDLFRDPNRPTQDDLLRGVSDSQRAQIISVIEALKRAG